MVIHFFYYLYFLQNDYFDSLLTFTYLQFYSISTIVFIFFYYYELILFSDTLIDTNNATSNHY